MFLPILEILAESYGPLRIFNYLTFRAILATLTSLIFCLSFGNWFITFLKMERFNQYIRKEGPERHLVKEGTPTMGGLLILAAVVFSVFCWGDLSNKYLWLVLFMTVSFGVIGWIDDLTKLKTQSSNGLTSRQKFFWQSLSAFIGIIIFYTYSTNPLETSLIIPFFKDFSLPLGLFFIFFSYFVIVGSSSAVNLTDGLDGLAIMPSVMIAAALGVLGYASGNIIISDYLNIPYLPLSGEMLVFCGAIVGSGIGFLWFNTYPAQVFMGDVGSLSLGAALGAIAVMIRQEIVFAIMAGVFVAETLSVMIQVTSYKLTGKRVFKMAPLHHHFELSGWAEPKIIVRFWIITLILILIGFATLRLR